MTEPLADQRLAAHPIATRLTGAQVAGLATCARLVQVPGGRVIFCEDGDADALYLILTGRIVLEQHVPGKGNVQLESLTGGDILGLSWLFPGGRWIIDARSAEPSELLMLDADCVKARMNADPELGLSVATYVIQQLYQRLERVRLQRLDVYRGEP